MSNFDLGALDGVSREDIDTYDVLYWSVVNQVPLTGQQQARYRELRASLPVKARQEIERFAGR